VSSNNHEKSIADSQNELTLEDFAYDLPEEFIAQHPAAERSASRLMVLHRKTQTIEHRIFSDLPEYLQAGDVLVLNDTRVIPARIVAQRDSGGQVEVLLLKPEATKPGVWQAMASPLRKLKVGDQLSVDVADGLQSVITVAGFAESIDGQRRVLIDFGGQAEVHSLLSMLGKMPLPPYIRRERSKETNEIKDDDLERYQTVYSRAPGAVAAPTAGLHFTPQLLAKIESAGVRICHLTLHVGPGTFKPITSSLKEHSVESEEFCISQETTAVINECHQRGSRVIAVGTTSCRSLETAAENGILNPQDAGISSLYIRPGFKFQMVDTLITNFHLSKSSLLVLVSAFAGHEFIMKAYKDAIAQRYRFYSYGDAMIIL
jgi:S-adenosylmethionine:tRNA ribosyltransferase-isomerase